MCEITKSANQKLNKVVIRRTIVNTRSHARYCYTWDVIASCGKSTMRDSAESDTYLL